MRDQFGREIHYLRVSVTDRCNLRCVYCMPPEGVKWIPHEQILSLEELLRLIRLFAALGIDRIKLTGGEPLVRRGLPGLIRQIREIPGIRQVTMTTNGVLFPPLAQELKDAGLDAVTFSLDTLRPERYAALTRRDALPQVLQAIRLAEQLGFSVKINTVLLAGQNEDELISLAALAQNSPLAVRFIELMPLGCGQRLPSLGIDSAQARLAEAFGPPQPVTESLGNGPASYQRYPGFAGAVGFIPAVSHPFCSGCNRVRLTSQGELLSCLHRQQGVALLPALRGGADDDTLLETIRQAIWQKPAHHHFECPSPNSQQMNSIGG